MYYDQDGNGITRQEIVCAVAEGRAAITWGHGNWSNVARLHVLPCREDAAIVAARDTRNHCWSMADEQWGEIADDVETACRAAAGVLTVS